MAQGEVFNPEQQSVPLEPVEQSFKDSKSVEVKKVAINDAMKLRGDFSTEVLQDHFYVLSNADEVKKLPDGKERIRNAALVMPEDALRYFEKYNDMPWAEEVVLQAVEDDPYTALEMIKSLSKLPYSSAILSLILSSAEGIWLDENIDKYIADIALVPDSLNILAKAGFTIALLRNFDFFKTSPGAQEFLINVSIKEPSLLLNNMRAATGLPKSKMIFEKLVSVDPERVMNYLLVYLDEPYAADLLDVLESKLGVDFVGRALVDAASKPHSNYNELVFQKINKFLKSLGSMEAYGLSSKLSDGYLFKFVNKDSDPNLLDLAVDRFILDGGESRDSDAKFKVLLEAYGDPLSLFEACDGSASSMQADFVSTTPIVAKFFAQPEVLSVIASKVKNDNSELAERAMYAIRLILDYDQKKIAKYIPDYRVAKQKENKMNRKDDGEDTIVNMESFEKDGS